MQERALILCIFMTTSVSIAAFSKSSVTLRIKCEQQVHLTMQIVVFIIAGVVVVAFIISAFHFVRALHGQQQAEIRLQASYRRDLEGVRAYCLPSSLAFKDLKTFPKSSEGFTPSNAFRSIIDIYTAAWANTTS